MEKIEDSKMGEESFASEQNGKVDWSGVSSVPFAVEQIDPMATFPETVAKIASTDLIVYERLNASNDKTAKEEFLKNPALIRPNNEYGNLDPMEVSENLSTLDEVDKQIAQSSFSEQQKRLLTALSDDCRRKNDFLSANIEYNAATTPEAKAEAALHHREANEALYGKPDEATFYSLLKDKLSLIDVDTLSDENRAKYEALLDKIGPIKEMETERFRPKPETVHRFGELVNEFFGGFLKHLPETQETFAGEDMARITNEILSEEFSDEPDAEAGGYHAVVSSDASNASANHERRQIIFSDSKTYSRAQAAGIIVHELGTHVLRAIPYLDQDVAAFATGFPDNETFDEGVAKCVEQAVSGKYVDSGVDHYINIGLATFMNKNFREVYEIQSTLNELLGKSNKTLLNGVQRCFRGTGELPNNKDLAYYNGANQVWKYIEEHIDDPELFDHLFLAGKLDITSPEQERLSYEKRVGGN